MLETLRNAFRIKDIQKKIFFYILLMLVVIRIGSSASGSGSKQQLLSRVVCRIRPVMHSISLMHLPVAPSTSMSIFALSITPYITSSIIIQLLTIAIPALEEMQKDGEDGTKENCSDHPLCDSCTGADREYCHDQSVSADQGLIPDH